MTFNDTIRIFSRSMIKISEKHSDEALRFRLILLKKERFLAERKRRLRLCTDMSTLLSTTPWTVSFTKQRRYRSGLGQIEINKTLKLTKLNIEEMTKARFHNAVKPRFSLTFASDLHLLEPNLTQPIKSPTQPDSCW